ncbi:hypothetical protein BGZ54_005599, partial [Gamsiella multidivaricata]
SRTQVHMLQQQPHDAFRRRPSLPNQPCLEDGEIMPVVKKAVRSHQNHYPSPDGGSEQPPHRLQDEEMMTPAGSSHSSPENVGHGISLQRSWTPASGNLYGRHSLPPLASLTYTNQAHGHVHPHAYSSMAHHESAGRNGTWTGSSRAMC